MKTLGLFSGIGGFELGLQRAGFDIEAMCENNPFCRRVLASIWPDKEIFGDVRELSAAALCGRRIDAICGGFPCQDISIAGLGAGLEGERSGLWGEYVRLIGELRPRYVLVENVANLLAGQDGRWFGRVLGDLASLGFDAEWHRISAADFGAWHERERIWVVAYAHGESHPDFIAAAHEWQSTQGVKEWDRRFDELGAGDGVERCDSYTDIVRTVHGIPDWAHATHALGNAVIPQIPELIGRAILLGNHVKREVERCHA